MKGYKTNPQVLLVEEGKILLARVLLHFDLPFKKYPEFGVFSYLIPWRKGVHVFDAGPAIDPLEYFLGIRIARPDNSSPIIDAVRDLFPKKPITDIILSHYHFDHSQNAPHLQKKAHDVFGILPPIRLHHNDIEDKRFMFAPSSLRLVLEKAGNRSWKLGKPLEEGRLEGTGFDIIHTPGHTSGTVSLIDRKRKIAIVGYWARSQPFFLDMANSMIHEDKKNLKDSRTLFTDDLTFYYHHPKIYH